MKKILLLLTISIAIISCNRVKKGEFLITGTAKGIADGKTVILNKPDQMLGSVAIDTAIVKNGKFELKGKIDETTICSIQVQDIKEPVGVIVESEAVTVTFDKDSIQNSKIGGSYNNEEFQKFNDEMKVQNKPIAKLNKAFGDKNKVEIEALQQKQMAKMPLNNADSLVIKRLNAEYESIGKAQEANQKVTVEKYRKYVETHPKSFISILILQGLMQNTEFEKFKKMYDGLDATLKSSKIGKEMKTAIDGYKKQPQPTVGPQPTAGPQPQAAQWIEDNNFAAKTPDGKTLSLKDVAGKITIIDFWASWCPFCRVENPEIVKIYNKYHAKGLNIIGVSLDNDVAKWKVAIAKDKITWQQVSTLEGWKCPIAEKYGVEELPSLFIIDANGNIIGKNIKGKDLEHRIASLLK